MHTLLCQRGDAFEAGRMGGAMTPKQYRAAIGKLGLSQTKAAMFLGISPRQSRRLVSGDGVVPASTEKLLCLMLKNGLTVDQVNEIAGPSARKSS